ncbi:MAG: ribose-phosphate diphosphokinase [Syntrophobacterales bacterium]|nr:ribose-phosphate diphosphokinase [Syntrophobacterales bacterium]
MEKRAGYRVFSGNANIRLANAVCSLLDIPRGDALVTTFQDGEIRIEIRDNVRGLNTYVIQSLCCPVNDHIMELLIMIDALKRASAKSVCAVIPYYAYGRRDKKEKPRVPITGRMLASLIEEAGVDHVVALDFHSGQTMGFFKVPVDHLSAMSVMVEHARKHLPPDSIVVAPDAAGVRRARVFASELDLDMAIMDEREVTPRIVGNVKGRHVVLYDDIVDTGRTIERVVQAALRAGAASVIAYCVHGIFSKGCAERIAASKLERLVVTDSVAPYTNLLEFGVNVEYITVAPLLAEAISALNRGETISSVFYSI